MALKVGDPAPAFEAPDQTGTVRSLGDYRGHYVLLYFYPKDDTPGCTIEACSFRDRYAELKHRVAILGVSADSEASHDAFAKKFSLPFPLLADPEKKIIQAYGTDGMFFAKRSSFLIGPDGTIVKIYDKVKPEEHVAEILADLPPA